MPFHFHKIDRNNVAIFKLSANTDGGLPNDKLIKYAKLYFHKLTCNYARTKLLGQANQVECQILVVQILQQIKQQSQ